MLFNWIKNTAGKDRYTLTITGSILVLLVAWVLGIIFMPKKNSEKWYKKLKGVWYSKHDSGFIRMEIKESGYFYYDVVLKNVKSHQYKGIIYDDQNKDTIFLKSFSGDTLLFGKIKVVDKHILIVNNKNNNADIKFTNT